MRRLAAFSVLVLVAAACGGGGGNGDGVASLEGSDTTVSMEQIEVDTEQQLLRFAACMREQGVDLPDPTVDIDGNVQLEPPPGFDPAADTGQLIEAAGECREYLEGVALGFEDIDLVAVTDTLVEFAACMRANGFDLPDPDFSLMDPGSGSIPTAGPFGNVDFGDQDFLDAFAVCDELIMNLGVQPPG